MAVLSRKTTRPLDLPIDAEGNLPEPPDPGKDAAGFLGWLLKRSGIRLYDECLVQCKNRGLSLRGSPE